jgi:DNA-directed RNA polymerase subunit omega
VSTPKASDDSKFRMILLAAKRARQLQSGAKPLIHTMAKKATRIAQDELKAGVLPFELLLMLNADGSPKDTSGSASRAKKRD